jgi:hypothetical protein
MERKKEIKKDHIMKDETKSEAIGERKEGRKIR